LGSVEGSVDALRAKHPGLSMQNATLLAACDLASQLIRGRQQARAYQSAVLDLAGKLLEKLKKSSSENRSSLVSPFRQTVCSILLERTPCWPGHLRGET
jgi:hypothetical protein